MLTQDEADALVARYRDVTIQEHGFDIGGDRETELCIFLEWAYDHGYYLDDHGVLQDEDWMKSNRPKSKED